MARHAEAKLFDWQKLKSPNGKNWFMIQGRPTGKRERFYFETEKDAKKAAADRNRQISSFGSQNTLSDSDRVMAAECIKMLTPFGKTLYQATHFYRDHLEKTTTSITVAELCDRVANIMSELQDKLDRGEISLDEYARWSPGWKKTSDYTPTFTQGFRKLRPLPLLIRALYRRGSSGRESSHNPFRHQISLDRRIGCH
jgi:hypothetical protein